VNNSLVFPGIFRGLIDSKKTLINMDMKLKAALALAEIICDKELNETHLLPNSLD